MPEELTDGEIGMIRNALKGFDFPRADNPRLSWCGKTIESLLFTLKLERSRRVRLQGWLKWVFDHISMFHGSVKDEVRDVLAEMPAIEGKAGADRVPLV